MRFLVRVEKNCNRESIENALRCAGHAYEASPDGFLLDGESDGFPTWEISVISPSLSDATTPTGHILDAIVFGNDETDFLARLATTLRIARAVALQSPYRKILDACPVRVFVQASDGAIVYENVASSISSSPPRPAVFEEIEPWTRQLDAIAEDDAFITPRARGWKKTMRAPTELGDRDVVVGITTDVSTDRVAREEMAVETEMLHRLIDAIPSYIFVTDEDERIVLVNAAMARYVGHDSQHLSGCEISELVERTPPLGPWRDACKKARESGDETMFSIEFSDDDGVLNAHNGSVRVTSSPNGLRWLLTVITDVSDLRRAQKEAEDARNHAVSASRVKSRFLANMSHEIRTPMNGVLGMLDLTVATKLTQEQREYVEAAQTSAQSLLAIINDILDISKIEAGKLSLESIPFSIQSALDALAPLRAQAREKGLTTRISVASNIHDRVMGDPVRFRQILVNLVGNAIKFTKHGKVDVSLTMDDAAPDMIHVAVSDSGIGIAKEQQVFLFDPFRQADETTTRKFGGTGLGLSICRELTALMGGRIWIDSDIGCGSSFHFTARLPAASDDVLAHETPEKPDDSTPRRRLRVLLAEDNAIGAKLAIKVLELEDCEVVHVADGVDAVRVAQTDAFDLILMDMQMPEMDGLEATAKIRAREKTSGGRVPIYALTANAMKGDADVCVAAGMDGHLAKPLDRVLFRRVINGVRRDTSIEPPSPVIASRKPAIDVAEALERCGGDQELLADLGVAFEESFRQNVTLMENAISARDGTAIYKAAHALKGVFAYLSANSGASLAQSLCNAGRENKLAEAAELLNSLREEGVAIREILDQVRATAPAA